MNSRTRKIPVEEQYEKSFHQATGANPVFPYFAKQQMGKMVEIIAKGNENIAQRIATNQTIAQKAGFTAEEYIAETFNLEATLNNSESQAITDMHENWSSYEWQGERLQKNDIPDIAIVKNGNVTSTAQSKFYNTPESTSAAMSEVKDGTVKYGNVDELVGPENQINPMHGEIGVGEHAKVAAEANKSRGGDPVKTKAYENTHRKSTSTITDGESSSTPLTKDDAEAMASGDKTKLRQTEGKFQTRSTVQQMTKAATGAAAMSAIVAGTINTVRYIQQVRTGKITLEKATFAIVTETVCSAADSAVKASANVGVQSLMVRYGAEKVLLGTLAKQGLGAMMRTNAITVGVICGIDLVKDLVQLGAGRFSEKEFYERQGKNVLNTSTGVVGGSLGAVAVSSVIATLGLSTAASSALMVAGGLSGGLIAGLAMTIAIENGVEKPYKDLVNNTVALNEAAQALNDISQNILHGQLLFNRFFNESQQFDVYIKRQLENIYNTSIDAYVAVTKI